jgi:elongation factor Ts
MSIDLIKSIRERTGLSLNEIKKAIIAMPAKAEDEIIDYLRKQGILKQQAKQDREVKNGGIFSYVHENKLGVLIEIKCETDFVARSTSFQNLGADLTLHIAAFQPKFIKTDEVDQIYISKELEIAKDQLIKEGKPENMIDKILEGKKSKILKEVSLLTQPFLKDANISVNERISQTIQETGENITVTRFVIFSLNS